MSAEIRSSDSSFRLPRIVFPLFAALILFPAVGHSQAIVKPPIIDKQDIRFNRLSVGGKPFKKWVIAIAQDNYGFIWLGTDDGLYRYDGYTLRPYRHDANNPRSLSDNTVKVVYKDRAGVLWIGTGFGGLDRLDPATDVFTHYSHDPDDNRSLSNNTVGAIYQDGAGSLWVGTNAGLDRLDSANRRFFHYALPPDDFARGSAVAALNEDSQGDFWVGSTQGVYTLQRSNGRFSYVPNGPMVSRGPGGEFINGLERDRSGILWLSSVLRPWFSAFNAKTREFTNYAFSGEESGSLRVSGVNAIHEDRNGMLWVATNHDGLLKFDRAHKTFVRYSTSPSGSLPDSVETLFEDSEGNMWLGGHAGVSRFETVPSPFVSYRHESHHPNSLRSEEVLCVHADARGFLWIGTQVGLHRLDRRTGQMVFYQHDPKNPYSLSYDEVSVIREDGSGGLWIGTHGGGLNRFDRVSERFFAYRHNPKDPQSLSSDLIQCLWVDLEGVLWVGTHGGGLNRFDPATGHFKAYNNDPRDPHSLSEDNVREIFADRTGTLWIGTNHGLNRFDRRSEQFTVYLHDSHNPATLSHNSIGSIFEDRRGTLWIGTRSGLDRFDRTRGSFQTFTTNDGIADDAIEAIREDSRGNLWLATHQGISMFHPLTKAVRNYSEPNGVPGDFSNPSGEDRSCVTPEGEIVFGSNHGVTVFSPDRLSPNPYLPPVVLTDFLLFSKPVLPATNSPLQQPIWAARSLILNPKQSIFTVEFAALSYVAPERNRYRYRLEGLENEWNEVGGERRAATYTNLPAAKYVFRVQGSNNDMVWNEKGVSLAITVLPPWWATWQFRTFLVLSIAALVFGAHRLRVRALRAAAAKLQIQVSERTRELTTARDAAEAANRAKGIFLAHMSHELRTPLNAILGFSGMVLRDPSLSDAHRKDLAIVENSGEHLLELIDDVLDMAKIETGGVVVERASIDLHRLVNDTVNMLRERARTKNLELFVDISSRAPHFVRSDPGKLRQVLTNLVGNAVKYTDEGSVVIRLDARPGDSTADLLLVFDVEDTGIGIAPEDQARIFDPFVQAGSARTRKGTGLGLSISRHFVQLLGGAIHVESAPGRGSCFHVEVPAQIAEASEVIAETARVEQVIGLEPGQADYRILIVEDQRENWLLLQRLLHSAGFQVRVVEDGGQAVETFSAWRPHFIWMDLRLPVLGGMEAARRIRELEDGREVTIVAVTASAFGSQREEVIASGFDDFLRKPYRSTEIFDCMALHLGVRYVYGQTAESAVSDLPGTLRPEDLATLPAALRDELEEAVMSLDPERVALLVSRVSEENVLLGSVLGRLADKLAYSPILSALKNSKSRFTQAGV
jgi:signal transduction histidine kinase/ligand-binding sensor domain-containing protein/CheY-like chemotaxis protein